MNKKDAEIIAETITNEQLKQMFETAKLQITNWEQVSSVNKGMTKGTTWNILAKNFDVNAKHHILAKINMIREFGEFLPNETKPKKTEKNVYNREITHQEPEF